MSDQPPKVQTDVVPTPQVPHRPEAREIGKVDACKLINRLLTGFNDGIGTKLAKHIDFSPEGRAEEWDFQKDSKFVARANKVKSLSRLEALERELMQQLERLDAVDEVFNGQCYTKDKLSQKVAQLQEGYHGLYLACMSAIREKTRETETAVMSLIAFLSEAGQRAKARYIRVLNAPSSVFEEDAFAKRYGKASQFEKHFEDTAALWVTGIEAENRDSFSSLSENAKSHWALSLINADIFQDGMIDRDLRLDLQAVDRRSGDDIRRMEEDTPNCLCEYRSNTPDAKHIVVCAGPLRVRRADHEFGEIEDVVVPLSYVLGGKLFYFASVNPDTSAATNVRQLKDEFTIKREYMDDDIRTLETPQLLSFDRAVETLAAQHVVSVQLSERSAKQRDENLYRVTLTGYRTASESNGDENDMHIMLVECMLERYFLQYKKEAEGIYANDIDSFRARVERELKTLVSEGDTDQKPLLEVDVTVGHDADNKPYLVISYTHRKGISDLEIVRQAHFRVDKFKKD